MIRILLPLLLLLPLFGCGAFSAFTAEAEAIQQETSELLEGVDDVYTSGEITADERDELIREILEESKARLDAAARQASDEIITTGNDALDLLLILLFGGASGGGALALLRRVRSQRSTEV